MQMKHQTGKLISAVRETSVSQCDGARLVLLWSEGFQGDPELGPRDAKKR